MRLCNSRIPEEHLGCYQMSQRNRVIIKMLYRCLRRCSSGCLIKQGKQPWTLPKESPLCIPWAFCFSNRVDESVDGDDCVGQYNEQIAEQVFRVSILVYLCHDLVYQIQYLLLAFLTYIIYRLSFILHSCAYAFIYLIPCCVPTGRSQERLCKCRSCVLQ